MRIVMSLAALIVAACTPVESPTPPEPAPASGSAATAGASSAGQASCIAKGGEWRPVCRMQQPECVLTFADAGKACTDGDDCDGDCMALSSNGFAPAGAAVTGVCAVNDDPCGCKQTVESGKATAAICID